MVSSTETGWSVSGQMKAEVFISGPHLIIDVYDPKSPSTSSATISADIKGSEITNAFVTSHRVGEGRATEYRFPYSGSMETFEYQASENGPPPGGRETIMLKSRIGFIGLTRERKAERRRSE